MQGLYYENVLLTESNKLNILHTRFYFKFLYKQGRQMSDEEDEDNWSACKKNFICQSTRYQEKLACSFIN